MLTNCCMSGGLKAAFTRTVYRVALRRVVRHLLPLQPFASDRMFPSISTCHLFNHEETRHSSKGLLLLLYQRVHTCGAQPHRHGPAAKLHPSDRVKIGWRDWSVSYGNDSLPCGVILPAPAG